MLAGSLAVAVSANAWWLLAHFITEPYHDGSVASAMFNRVAQLLWFPGGAFARATVAGWESFTLVPLAAMVAFNLSFYFAISFLACRAWTHKVDVATPADEPGAAPLRRRLPRITRIIRGFMQLGLALLLGGGAYAVVIEPGNLRVIRKEVWAKGLPDFRIVQLSDLHYGPWFSLDYIREVVNKTNALEPDIVIITGDFISDRGTFAEPLARVLADLKPRIGTFGVLGNHDWWADDEAVRQACARHGIRLLDNSRVFITPDGRVEETTTHGLCLAGIGDLWTDEINPDRALAGLGETTIPTLLMSHNPDAAEEPNVRDLRIVAMISGHTHGGQVRLPWLGRPIVPSDHGQKYAYGTIQTPNFPVHVTSGVGMAVLPVRLGVPPELVVYQLRDGIQGEKDGGTR